MNVQLKSHNERIINGNIFDSTADVLVNPVNCVGVMGAGLAKRFKSRFPENYQSYKVVCDLRDLRPGNYFLFSGSKPRILNFATKDHWREPSKLDWIEEGLNKLIKETWAKDLSFAFPLLGGGLGGIPPAVAQDAMVRILKKAPFEWELYLL